MAVVAATETQFIGEMLLYWHFVCFDSEYKEPIEDEQHSANRAGRKGGKRTRKGASLLGPV